MMPETDVGTEPMEKQANSRLPLREIIVAFRSAKVAFCLLLSLPTFAERKATDLLRFGFARESWSRIGCHVDTVQSACDS